MADLSPEEQRELKRFDVALATRQFEIDLFWKRSLFFWGFIAVAFAAVAALEGKSRALAVIVAGFGMICSLGWTLANRGSKYWQEQWESKIGAAESNVTGPWFNREEPRQDKGWWLSSRRYSVSKLTIALSDYVLVIWAILFFRQAWLALGGAALDGVRVVVIVLVCLLTVLFTVLLVTCGKSTPRAR